ncbi:hypothetical protein [Cellulomonas sp. KRMCY2]|uniref:hypothetical protein n=1 Tax=Cellulomonas sp. KRMCY2 TaxID=1304865 RepID=UPI00045E6C24|nr:hypothetical protein [Cellulomonas sp. KRMCY2]
MATITIPLVRGWDTGALTVAADRLGTACTDLDHEVQSLQAAMDVASTAWSGPAADAAAARVATEVAAGRDVSAAVEVARAALADGGARLTTTRSHLLAVVGDAETRGFQVAEDGAVRAPSLPPVMTAPGDTTALQERNAEQTRLNTQARATATVIGDALAAVVQADQVTAGALQSVTIPASVCADVDAYLERLRGSDSALDDLAAAGAGGWALVNSLKKAWTLFGRSRAYVSFLTATAGQLRNWAGAAAFATGASADATAFARFTMLGRSGQAAVTEFRFGATGGLLSRVPFVGTAAKWGGRAFLPLTVVTGVADVVTGGGYDGSRGLTTRVAGAAGAVGAGALLASSAGLIALGPVGLGIAGAAVLAYGVWSLGNYVYDNWGAITDFTGRAAGWVGDRFSDAADWAGDRVSDAGQALSTARGWAGDRLSDAGDAVGSAVDAVADTGKDIVDGALNIVSLGWL